MIKKDSSNMRCVGFLGGYYPEHGIPDFFRSCGHETPFSDQKGYQKLGIRALLPSFVTTLQDDTKE
jgi:hypothetical protein